MADTGSILDYVRAAPPDLPPAPLGVASVPACGCTGGAPRKKATRADNVAPAPGLDEGALWALAEVSTTPDECAEDVRRAPGAPCSSQRVTKAIAAFAAEAAETSGSSDGAGAAAAPEPVPGILGFVRKAPLLPEAPTPEARAVRAAAAALGCAAESCVVAHPAFRRYAAERGLLPEAALSLELETRFKAPGPRGSKGLLSNYNIDETLRRWARVFPEFHPCPFAMMDFERNGDRFGEVDLAAVLEGRAPVDLGPGFGVVRRPATCFACVLNTDTSTGPGKHWVAVFVDCRPAGGEPWTVEYFNSAGNPPPRAVTRWSERARARLAAHRQELPPGRQGDVAAVPVTDVDHQESQTECGLYALFYIRSRLEGVPYSFFLDRPVPDDAMTAFRAHVFRAAP